MNLNADTGALCSSCGHVPREGFGCAGRPTPSDIWAGVYPSDCDCDDCTNPPEPQRDGGAS